VEALRAYPFPGNVRELENILERAMALAEGEVIEHSDLRLPAWGPAGVSQAQSGAREPAREQPLLREPMTRDPRTADPRDSMTSALPSYIEEIERNAIQQALEDNRYNKTKAAAALGITFRALRYKLKKLGIESWSPSSRSWPPSPSASTRTT
jgi:two-component system response regulator PilR (NtrC family)